MISFKAAELHRHASPHPIAIPRGGMLKANLVVWLERGRVGLFW